MAAGTDLERPSTVFDGVAAPAGARVIDGPDGRDELAELFADRPAVHVYALADLDEPYWSASRWFRRGDAPVGLVGLPGGDGLACYAVSTRDPSGSVALLAELAPSLPAGLLITGPVGFVAMLGRIRPVEALGHHVRYELVTPPTVLAGPGDRVVALGPGDAAELAMLYDTEPGAAFFLPHMLDDGAFVGVRDPAGDPSGALVAAAGTHVVSTRRRVAAIGAVYTAPSHRGRGLGRTVTAGAVARLAGRVDLIGLNVAADNASARRIYESLGFEAIHTYEEAAIV